MTVVLEKKKGKEKLSLVVPAYNEEEALPIFYREARKVEEQLPQVEIEYLFVDDGSVDGTMDVIRRLHEEDPRVHYVSFSRNFGKEAAHLRGTGKRGGRLCGYSGRGPSGSAGPAPGDAADCDGGRLRLCGSRRVSRKGEPPIRSWFARMFYRIMNRIPARMWWMGPGTFS